MKAIFTPILAFLCIISVTSCKSDDDGTPAPASADLIVGTWDMTANTVDDGNATVTVQGFPLTADFTWEGKNYDYQLTFDEDNMVGENGSFTIDLTYEALGQTETEVIPLETGNGDLLLSGQYSVSENQLTVTNEGELVTATIEELSETTLRLSIDLASVSPQIVDDTVENATGTNKITFSRQ
ncbi:MAG TPA: hypothetical protein ENH91_05585 [Leeuwenhoekiella sp.]|nr:hypothetical protein [Leeuwenhoekiella sp.]